MCVTPKHSTKLWKKLRGKHALPGKGCENQNDAKPHIITTLEFDYALMRESVAEPQTLNYIKAVLVAFWWPFLNTLLLYVPIF